MPRLSQSILPALTIAKPAYDRATLTAGIVHFGVGGFHRAHQAVYLDDLMNRGKAQEWSICGVGLLPGDSRMRDALVPQDGLYTVVTRDRQGDQARVVGSIVRYLLAPDDPELVLAALAAPGTRLVTLTITEGGYNTDGHTGTFNMNHPDIAHDLAHPARPVSVFGYLAEGLVRRRRAGLAPFSILSCDNIQGNGTVMARCMEAFAGARDPHLARWMETNVAFPNCMVDRITPQTTDAERDLARTEFGIDDAWPVVCEPFRQWVIEDVFSNGRPPLEDVGAQLVADVRPYETIKLRLLNAGHSALGYLGWLAGYRTIDCVASDPQFQAFLRGLWDSEVTPLLLPVPGMDLAEYKATLLTRFANPRIADQVARICLDGSSKMPKFLLPSLHEQLAQNGPRRALTLATAGWLRYLSGVDEQGQAYKVDDPQATLLQARAVEGGSDPRPLLSVRSVFGDLGDNTAFVQELGKSLTQLYAQGARATLAAHLGE